MGEPRRASRNKKILVQVGLLVVALFAVSGILNAVVIRQSGSKNYYEMLEVVSHKHTEHNYAGHTAPTCQPRRHP